MTSTSNPDLDDTSMSEVTTKRMPWRFSPCVRSGFCCRKSLCSLAYLLADPELSLQSILITNSVIGRKKTAAYVVLVVIFSTLSGLIFGWFVK